MSEEPLNSLPITQPNSCQSTQPATEVLGQTGCCGGQNSCETQPTEKISASALGEDLVREQLKQVIDPELFVNIVDLGLIYTVELSASESDPSKQDVKVEMTLTSPMCPAGPQLVANSRQVIEAIEGVAAADIKVVMDPPWSPDRMSEDARDQLNIF